MGRPRQGNFNQIPLNLNRDEVDKFNENFGQGRLSEIVREFIHDENERVEKEKKGTPPTKGALVNYTNQSIYIHPRDKRQATLDFFAKERDVVTYINELKEQQDDAAIRRLGRNGQLAHDICKTYFRKPRRS